MSTDRVVEIRVSPRPEKLSTRNDAIPISLKVFAQNSSRALEPPEPCWRITAGNRPAEPWGNRNWPAIVTALPFLSPVKNCRTDRVRVSMGCNSVRAAKSFRLGSATAGWPQTRPRITQTAENMRFIDASLSPVATFYTDQISQFSSILVSSLGFLPSLDHLVRSRQQIRRNRHADLLSGFQVYHQLKLHWLLHREISGFRSFENLVDVNGRGPPHRWAARAVRHKTTVINITIMRIDCRQFIPSCKINNLLPMPTISMEKRVRGH